MEKSPAENYIKYLMLLPDGLSDDDIKGSLRDLGLDNPSVSYLARLRETLKVPKPFRPMMNTHLESYRFLVKHKVHMLFFPDEDVRCALELLKNARARETVESLLIVGEMLALICSRLRSDGFIATPKAIQYYEHFFWNVKHLDSSQIRMVLSLRLEALKGPDPDSMARYEAMKKAMYYDARYLAANCPSKDVARTRLSMRRGIVPAAVDLQRLMKATQIAAIQACGAEILSGGPRAAMNAREYANVAVQFHMMAKEMTPVEEAMEGVMKSVGLTTDQNPVPTIHQLAGETYTDSVQLTEATNDE